MRQVHYKYRGRYNRKWRKSWKLAAQRAMPFLMPAVENMTYANNPLIKFVAKIRFL